MFTSTTTETSINFEHPEIVQYKLVVGKQVTLNKEINELLGDGFTLYGPLGVDQSRLIFYQAMVKYDGMDELEKEGEES